MGQDGRISVGERPCRTQQRPPTIDRMSAPMTGSQLLAYDLGLSADEIIAFAAIRYGWDVDDATDEEVAAVRLDLDPYCIRSVPQYWWPSEWPDGKVCRRSEERRVGQDGQTEG